METSEEPHSIWICPAPEVAGGLRAEIETLCALSGTAAFEPHITLLGDLHGPAVETHALCQRFFEDHPQIDARVIGIGRTEHYFMSLFLDLALSLALDDTRSAIAQALGRPAPDAFRPHLSLAYGLGDSTGLSAARDRMAAYVGKSLALTSVVTVASAVEIPIAHWRVLNVHPFGQKRTGSVAGDSPPTSSKG